MIKKIFKKSNQTIFDILRPQKKISTETENQEGLKKGKKKKEDIYRAIQQEFHLEDFSSEAVPVCAKPPSSLQNIQGIFKKFFFLFLVTNM